MELLFDLTFVVAVGRVAAEFANSVAADHLGRAVGSYLMVLFTLIVLVECVLASITALQDAHAEHSAIGPLVVLGVGSLVLVAMPATVLITAFAGSAPLAGVIAALCLPSSAPVGLSIRRTLR